MASPQASSLAPPTVGRSADDLADIALLHDLVAVESLSGDEHQAVAFLVDAMRRRGFDAHIDEAGSAIGTIGSGTRHIVLLGHIDTVPGQIPVRIEDGVLHGRGSVDAKGPLATFAAAASRAAADLNVRVTVVGATGEESMGSPGATAVAAWPSPAFCIIGEPSGWDAVCLGYRGSMSARYRLTQSSRHSAGPGESAAEGAIRFWNALVADIAGQNAQVSPAAAGVFPRITPSIRSFNTSADGMSETVEMALGLRLPPGLDVDALIARMQRLAVPGDLTIEGFQRGYRSARRTPLAAPFLRAIRAADGTPKFTVKLGTSDMSVVGPAWGCPTVAYGPGDAALDHTPDEHIRLDEYLAAVRVLTGVLRSFPA